MIRHFTPYKLHFQSPLHLSKGKEDYDESLRILHSDTIKAALFTCALQLGKTDQQALALMDGCILSSAFPFCKGEYFFPKPYSLIQSFMDENDPTAAKSLKKIRFMGKSFFEDLLNGGKRTIDNGKHLVAGGDYLSDHPDLAKDGKILTAAVSQRVKVAPDYIEDAQTFYTERLYFNEGAGLYFLAVLDEEMEDLFWRCLCLLGENGVGTDRSVGNGFFSPEKAESMALEVPDNAGYQINLSLYCPSREELNEQALEHASYQIVKRGGYMASAADIDHITLRKHSVYMFEEGSVFSTNKQLTGKRIDLKPRYEGLDHAVWRDGRALFLPIIPKAKNDD